MAKSNLKNALSAIEHDTNNTDKESLVSIAWIDDMKAKWPKLKLGRINNCDAYVQADGFAMLIEFKYDVDQQSPAARARVIAQVIAYYERILSGKKVARTPDIIVVADVNECFVVHVNYINKFVSLLDKKLAPSDQCKNAALVGALTCDKELNDNTVVYHVNDPDFDPDKIFNYMESLAKGVVRIVPITQATLKKGFDFFAQKILLSTEGMSANELVGRYYAFIESQDTAFIANGMIMGIEGYAPVKVNEPLARQFKNRFGVISKDDHKELERMYDSLLGEAERRFNGQFFTPRVWVDEGHNRVARVLGENWEANTPTWDNCCGTKSLTRDYEWESLFLSTLDKNELNASKELSTDAKETFQFDFLNGNINRLPASLDATLKNCAKTGKPFVFFVNPPYGQATSGRANKHKDGISETAIQKEMKVKGLGKPANELTVQFLWQMLNIVKKYRLHNVVLGLFSNPNWMTGDSFEPFRDEWLKHAKPHNGFIFRSEEFQGVKPGWAINFSVWTLSA